MTYYEMKYWELREEMDRARDARDWDKYNAVKEEFFFFCADVLEIIMEENSEILKNLKER